MDATGAYERRARSQRAKRGTCAPFVVDDEVALGRADGELVALCVVDRHRALKHSDCVRGRIIGEKRVGEQQRSGGEMKDLM
jgi:hypothetical protein